MSFPTAKLLRTALLSIPPLCFVKDTFFSIHKIEGNTMHPVLIDGDFVLIRKADFLPGWIHEKFNVADFNNDSQKIDEENDRCLALRMDEIAGVTRPAQTTLWRFPPSILPGDIVAYYSLSKPRKVEVQRVVALGGQRVRIKGTYHKIISLRPYYIYTEEDGVSELESTPHDLQKYDGISKKLLLGKAERIVWPPHRWSVLERKRPAVGRAWWS